jgi:hypothetical protein
MTMGEESKAMSLLSTESMEDGGGSEDSPASRRSMIRASAISGLLDQEIFLRTSEYDDLADFNGRFVSTANVNTFHIWHLHLSKSRRSRQEGAVNKESSWPFRGEITLPAKLILMFYSTLTKFTAHHTSCKILCLKQC